MTFYGREPHGRAALGDLRLGKLTDLRADGLVHGFERIIFQDIHSIKKITIYCHLRFDQACFIISYRPLNCKSSFGFPLEDRQAKWVKAANPLADLKRQKCREVYYFVVKSSSK